MRKPIPTWIAVLITFLLGVISFSLLRSAWSIVLFGVLVLGTAVIHRVVSRRLRR
ncbi:hypothetical protein ACR8AL_13285 [Clavibacter sepedonicus]|nr:MULTISPECIES: hypothetical protein [Clavibacter]MBD5380394.1 hypothetical protein [Clavibacter sp.]UUK64751.1 hypothetical protein LRE50_10670 [Clavibacter sepedonicus]